MVKVYINYKTVKMLLRLLNALNQLINSKNIKYNKCFKYQNGLVRL